MVKKGDTLIEVVLAVGIFSMVAIAVVAVMTGGTSSAQNALETTLAREEIDTQAEALRFIHASYLADEGSGDAPFATVWKKITDNAYKPGNNKEENEKFQQFNPASCQNIYDSGVNGAISRAFVINPYAFANLTPSTWNKAYVSYSGNKDKFQQTTTYPRLVYSATENEDSLVTNSGSADLFQAAGIYVLAVADPESTAVVGSSRKAAAYYDFYIRTCWYSTGSDTPTTLSTVIRLYDPKGVK